MTGLRKLHSQFLTHLLSVLSDRRVVPLFQEEDQQQRVLVGLVSGEPVGCPAITVSTQNKLTCHR